MRLSSTFVPRCRSLEYLYKLRNRLRWPSELCDERAKSSVAHPDESLFHQRVFGRTYRCFPNEIGSRTVSQAGGAIDECEVVVGHPDRDRATPAFDGLGHILPPTIIARLALQAAYSRSSGKFMSTSAFLSEVSDEHGVSPGRLSAALRITMSELAAVSGLPPHAFARGITEQTRLAEMCGIIDRAVPWAGSVQAAYAWYRSQALPSFGDATAEELVRHGYSHRVQCYLDRTAAAGFT